ncbi:MAG TPA: hypothetical protein VFH31_00255 [Pyrinomonadaceae bacterium]|nr:hypothetical protein [Pyrinomonadaceae bacterium]
MRKVSRLKSVAYHKIQVPLPLAAGLLIGFITVTVFAVFGTRQIPGQSSASATSPSVIIKHVEVPVDRVITRTVYVKQLIPQRVQIHPRKDSKSFTSPHSKENIAQNNPKALEWSDDVLKGFRPAVDANFRVVKEHEK